jgi:hypothetical protein
MKTVDDICLVRKGVKDTGVYKEVSQAVTQWAMTRKDIVIKLCKERQDMKCT